MTAIRMASRRASRWAVVARSWLTSVTPASSWLSTVRSVSISVVVEASHCWALIATSLPLPGQDALLDPVDGQALLARDGVGEQAALGLVGVGLELVEGRLLLGEQVGEVLEPAEGEPVALGDAVQPGPGRSAPWPGTGR